MRSNQDNSTFYARQWRSAGAASLQDDELMSHVQGICFITVTTLLDASLCSSTDLALVMQTVCSGRFCVELQPCQTIHTRLENKLRWKRCSYFPGQHEGQLLYTMGLYKSSGERLVMSAHAFMLHRLVTAPAAAPCFILIQSRLRGCSLSKIMVP